MQIPLLVREDVYIETSPGIWENLYRIKVQVTKDCPRASEATLKKLGKFIESICEELNL